MSGPPHLLGALRVPAFGECERLLWSAENPALGKKGVSHPASDNMTWMKKTLTGSKGLCLSHLSGLEAVTPKLEVKPISSDFQ